MTQGTQQKLHIAYDDVGSGDPAVVLVHGLFANRTYYEAQVRHLAQQHRVVNIDLRGHGDSDVPENGYNVDALADDVAGVCDDIGVTRAVFCGHSIPVALRVAARRPDLAAGVVLLDGAVLLPPPVEEHLNAVLVQALETEAWREALLGFFATPERAGSAAERVAADISVAPSFYAASLMRAACTAGDEAREIAGLGCPLLYVHGEIPADFARLQELQPDALIEEILGAGHYLMLTAPDRVNEVLDRFLEVVGAS